MFTRFKFLPIHCCILSMYVSALLTAGTVTTWITHPMKDSDHLAIVFSRVAMTVIWPFVFLLSMRQYHQRLISEDLMSRREHEEIMRRVRDELQRALLEQASVHMQMGYTRGASDMRTRIARFILQSPSRYASAFEKDRMDAEEFVRRLVKDLPLISTEPSELKPPKWKGSGPLRERDRSGNGEGNGPDDNPSANKPRPS